MLFVSSVVSLQIVSWLALSVVISGDSEFLAYLLLFVLATGLITIAFLWITETPWFTVAVPALLIPLLVGGTASYIWGSHEDFFIPLVTLLSTIGFVIGILIARLNT